MTIDLFYKKREHENLNYMFEKLLEKNETTAKYQKLIKKWLIGFIDNDNNFSDRFRNQDTFVDATWELYLKHLFYIKSKNKKWNLNQEHDVPDLILKNETKTILIEAVTANMENNKQLQHQKNIEKRIENTLSKTKIVESQNHYDNKTELRYTNAIAKKTKKYQSYLKKPWTKEKDPYVIALNDRHDESSGQTGMSEILKILYGIEKIKNGNYNTIKEIQKNANTDVKIGYFRSPNEYQYLSGVLFATNCATAGKWDNMIASKIGLTYQKRNKSNMAIRVCSNNPIVFNNETEITYSQTSLQDPEYIEDGLVFFENPYTKNKVDEMFLKQFNIPKIYFDFEKKKIVWSTAKNKDGKNRPFMISHLGYDYRVDKYIQNEIKKQTRYNI